MNTLSTPSLSRRSRISEVTIPAMSMFTQFGGVASKLFCIAVTEPLVSPSWSGSYTWITASVPPLPIGITAQFFEFAPALKFFLQHVGSGLY